MSFLSLLNVLKVTQKADQGRLTSKHGYGTVKIFKRTETEQYIPATHFQFKAEEDKNPQNGYIATNFARREAVNQFARADFESKGLIGAAVAYNQKQSVVKSFCQKNVKETGSRVHLLHAKAEFANITTGRLSWYKRILDYRGNIG